MRQCQKGVSGAADGDAQLVVFPEPQICETTGLAIRLDRGVRIDVGERAPELELHAASLIERELGSGGGMTLVIGTPESNPRVATDILRRLDGVPNSDQGYILCVAADRITVAGVTSVGVLYGAQTLLQIIEREGGEVSVPECTIIDWPDRRYRGIFAESRWCSELMTLQDWKEAVDLLASLKFNVLSIGIANNWMIQYEGKRSEFFLVPIRKYPELRRVSNTTPRARVITSASNTCLLCSSRTSSARSSPMAQAGGSRCIPTSIPPATTPSYRTRYQRSRPKTRTVAPSATASACPIPGHTR